MDNSSDLIKMDSDKTLYGIQQSLLWVIRGRRHLDPLKRFFLLIVKHGIGERSPYINANR